MGKGERVKMVKKGEREREGDSNIREIFTIHDSHGQRNKNK